MTSTYARVPTGSQPQPNPNYYTTAQLQTTRVPSFPGAFHGSGRANANHPPSPLNPHPRWDPHHHHNPSPVLSAPIDGPDPATIAEPYQEFEFVAGTSEHSSSASSSIRHLKARERRPGSGSGSGRSVPLPGPLTYGVQKSEEYNPCAHGYHDPDKRKYGKCGIAAAVLFFPLGILCLLRDTSKRCKRCGQKLDSSSTGMW